MLYGNRTWYKDSGSLAKGKNVKNKTKNKKPFNSSTHFNLDVNFFFLESLVLKKRGTYLCPRLLIVVRLTAFISF